MKAINKDVLRYMHKITDLVVELENVIMYYQSNISLLSVYALLTNSKGYKYQKELYIDGFLSTEDEVISNLIEIIKDLEEMKNEQSNFNGTIDKGSRDKIYANK